MTINTDQLAFIQIIPTRYSLDLCTNKQVHCLLGVCVADNRDEYAASRDCVYAFMRAQVSFALKFTR